jgi:hypothetical protein
MADNEANYFPILFDVVHDKAGSAVDLSLFLDFCGEGQTERRAHVLLTG